MGIKKFVKIEAVQAIQALTHNRAEIEQFVGADYVHDTLPNGQSIEGVMYFIVIEDTPMAVKPNSWVAKDIQSDAIEVWQDQHFKEHFKDAYHGDI